MVEADPAWLPPETAVPEDGLDATRDGATSGQFDQFKAFEDRFGRAAIFDESSYTTSLLDRSQVRTHPLVAAL
jgi:PAB1-binding protein PBP1